MVPIRWVINEASRHGGGLFRFVSIASRQDIQGQIKEAKEAKMKFSTTTTLLAILALGLCLAGCSEPTSTVAPQAASLDTAPPAVPSGLNAVSGRSTVKLAWRPNVTDYDLEGFHVYRVAFGQVWPLTETPVTGNGFVDRAPLSGYATYAVTAVDQSGNESAWAQIRYNYETDDVAIDHQ